MEIKCIEKLLHYNKVPALFIGSGLTKRYNDNYPSWGELLKNLSRIIGITDSQYVNMYNKLKRDNDSDFAINVDMASMIENKLIERIDKEGDTFLKQIFTEDEIKNINSNMISHFKVLVAKQFSGLKINSKIDELNLFKTVAQRVPIFITTNYDCFLEKGILIKDFTVFNRQNEYFSDKSYNIKELYKIHGTVEDSESIIITKKDYENFEDRLMLVSSKLMTILSEYPIIFIGYSLSDPNIQKIMSNLVQCLNREQIQEIQNNFIFVQWEEGQKEIKEQVNSYQLENGKSINMTTLSTDNYAEIYNNLKRFTPTLPINLIKKVRTLIRDIIVNKYNKEKIYCSSIDDIETNDLAIYLGDKATINNMVGYKSIKSEDLFLDALFDSNKYVASTVLTITMPEIVKSKIMLPIFYYTKKAKDVTLTEKVQKYLNEMKDSYFSKTVLRNYMYKESFDGNYDSIKLALDKISKKYMKYCFLFQALHDKKEIFTTQNFKEILIYLYEQDQSAITDSQFKRLIMYADMI